MIRITLIYRRSKVAYFDFDYYVNHHVEMSRRLLADCGLSSIEVQKCDRMLDGAESDVICISPWISRVRTVSQRLWKFMEPN